MFKTVITDSVYRNIIAEERKAPSDCSYLYRLLRKCRKENRLILLTAEETATLAAHPEIVLENPSSFYVLDIAPEEAQAIQEGYGVMCTGGANPDMHLLIDVNDVYNPGKGRELKRGWDSVLDSVEDLPSNALLVSDRYLFSHPQGVEAGNGFDNIRSILRELLPQRFVGGEFQLTVVFGRKKLAFEFNMIVRRIQEIMGEVVDGRYPYVTEVFCIPEKTTFHDNIHSRRIMSNYYLVEATHKLAAFHKRVGTVNQTLIPMGLFTKSSLRGESTPPLDSVEQTVKSFQEFYEQISSPSYGEPKYLYALNGEQKPKCTGIRNRLLK